MYNKTDEPAKQNAGQVARRRGGTALLRAAGAIFGKTQKFQKKI